jgi:hypothetical protein
MRMHKAGDELITEDRVDPLIGHDHTLEQSSCGQSDEESRLRSEFGSSSVLPAIYVKEIVDIPSAPFIGKHLPDTCGSRAVVVIEDAAIRQTLSHEAGHAMGLGHQETPRNLMRSAPFATDTKLEDDQIRTIRSSSFAR